jgi:antitoxin component of MazEF toxin-antitoxin module
MGHEINMQVVEREGGPQYTITIPRSIAQAMGFKKGDVIDLSIQNGKIVLQHKTKQ